MICQLWNILWLFSVRAHFLEMKFVKFGISIHQVRELNMYKTVDRTIHKQEFDPANLIKCWETCMEKSSYYNRKRAVEEFNQQSFWKKRGIAIIPMKFSVGFPRTFYNQVTFRNA